jgi:pimeloyl-ACP methyl ester carboxylesterase
MESSYLAVDGISIAYRLLNAGERNTIFFIHGNSGSSDAWRKQLSSPLLANYRLIAADLPNHGNSSPLEANGDFSLPGIAKIVATAVALLGNGQPYIICAISLGTNIVAEMPVGETEPAGYFFAGPCIIGEGFGMDKMILPDLDPTAIFTDNAPEEGLIKYASETSASTDASDLGSFLKDYYAVRGNFRSSLYASIAAGNYNDQISLIQKRNCPVCIVFGKAEKVVNTNYLNAAPINLWNQTIYEIPGASHLVNIDAPDAFNEVLAAFAKDMFTTNAHEKQS